jgi:hypothetical protein
LRTPKRSFGKVVKDFSKYEIRVFSKDEDGERHYFKDKKKSSVGIGKDSFQF